MAALLLIYFWFFAPKPEERQLQPAVPTEQPAVTRDPDRQPSISQLPDEPASSQLVEKATVDTLSYGRFAPALNGTARDYTLENEKIKVTWSNKGGVIKDVLLKEYTDYLDKPLVLMDDVSSRLDYIISTAEGEIRISDLYFTDVQQATIGDTSVITFRLPLDDRQSITHEYRLVPGDYQVKQKTLIKGLNDFILDDKVVFMWQDHMKRLEHDLEYSRYYTTINYYETGNGFDNLKPRSSDKEEYIFQYPVKWLAFKQKFFTAGIVFDRPVDKGIVTTNIDENDTLYVKYGSAMAELPLSRFSSGEGNQATYFFGPNRLNVLKRMGNEFTENLYLGWPVINWINKYAIIPIFTFLEKYFSNYGIIIILLVLIVKLVLSPLTYKSHISMAKTKALKPELDALKAQYGDDMQKQQSEQMKLYQQVGVNPLSGCIPMLLQMPILFAMFQFIPHAIELRHEPFLWASDLSTYDSVLNLPFTIPGYGSHVSLFTLLMTLSTILYTWANSQATASVTGPMKSMQYIMPVVFMFVLNKFPAGLTFYYFVSNIVSFGQIAIIRRFVDDDKIRAILEENKKKNVGKKKSAFQARLEDALKASEESKRKPRQPAGKGRKRK